MPDRDIVVQRLTELNEEFRRLRDEHQAHERGAGRAPGPPVPLARTAVARERAEEAEADRQGPDGDPHPAESGRRPAVGLRRTVLSPMPRATAGTRARAGRAVSAARRPGLSARPRSALIRRRPEPLAGAPRRPRRALPRRSPGPVRPEPRGPRGQGPHGRRLRQGRDRRARRGRASPCGSAGDAPGDPAGRGVQGRRPRRRPAGGHHGGQADGRADSALPPARGSPASTSRFTLDRARSAVHVETAVRTVDKTGVEMEALTAAAGAGLDRLRHGEGDRAGR